MHEWLTLFKQHILSVLDEIDTTRAARDNKQMKRLMHQLESSCISMGMCSTSTMCAAFKQQPLDDFPLREKIQQDLYEVEC